MNSKRQPTAVTNNYNSGCAEKVHGAANEFLAAWGRIGQWWLHGKTAVSWLNLDCQVILLCVCVFHLSSLCFTWLSVSVRVNCFEIFKHVCECPPLFVLGWWQAAKEEWCPERCLVCHSCQIMRPSMSADDAPCYTSMSCASRTQLFHQLRTDKQKCWPRSLRRRLTFHAWRESFSTVIVITVVPSTSGFCRTLERYCHDSWGWSTLQWAKMPKWRNFSNLTMLCNVMLCLMHRSTWCMILSNLVNESCGVQGCMEEPSWHWMAHGYSSPEAVFSHHGRCWSDVLHCQLWTFAYTWMIAVFIVCY